MMWYKLRLMIMLLLSLSIQINTWNTFISIFFKVFLKVNLYIFTCIKDNKKILIIVIVFSYKRHRNRLEIFPTNISFHVKNSIERIGFNDRQKFTRPKIIIIMCLCLNSTRIQSSSVFYRQGRVITLPVSCHHIVIITMTLVWRHRGPGVIRRYRLENDRMTGLVNLVMSISYERVTYYFRRSAVGTAASASFPSQPRRTYLYVFRMFACRGLLDHRAK